MGEESRLQRGENCLPSGGNLLAEWGESRCETGARISGSNQALLFGPEHSHDAIVDL